MTDHLSDHLADPGPLIPGRRHHAFLAEARELLRLAVPMAATQLAQMIILATDTVMLGHFSKEALAAAAVGNTVYFLAWLLGSGMPMAVSPVIAHVQGRHGAATKPRAGLFDGREVRIVVRMGLWSVAMSSLPLLGLLIFTRPILLALHQEPRLAADAAVFMSGLAWGLPFALGFQVLRSFSTALSRAVPPLTVMGLAILWNACGDYGLIFGHFGLPQLGLFGAGLSSASSNIFSFLMMLTVCLAVPALRRYHILHRLWHPAWRCFAELFRLGLPIGVTMVFEVALFNAAALAMGTFGIATLAAHQIAITIPSLTFMIPLGIGLAATVRVGLAAGAGDRIAARRAGFTAIAMGAAFMCVAALVLVAWPLDIATLWLPDSAANRDVLALAVTFLHVAAAFQLMDGVQVTAAMSLRGLKDARGPMWIAGASYWLVGAPMCLWLGFGTGLKGFGIWLGLAFGLTVAAITLTTRFAILSKRPLGSAHQAAS
ncbi:MAG TPA: MATE family efflux transporter [Rhizomicrobium sp.]|jgi:MATE family multidrug resistance protein|nr:MATE family efflux transporter [Rhizomicrobium sp.]